MSKSGLNKLTIQLGDALKINLPDNSVDMIMTHPPYFGVSFDRYGGKPEDQINSFDRKKMLKLLHKATKEAFRVLKPSGHFVIANGPVDNVDSRYLLDVVDNTKFLHVATVIQNSYDTRDLNNKMSELITNNNIVTWYHFIKGYDAYGNPYKIKQNNNPVWNIPFNNLADSVDVELSKDFFVGDAVNKEMPKRFIEMLTKPGDIVVDPFGGSGIIPITAVELGRVGVCFDISPDQVKAAKARASLVFGKDKYKKLVGEND